MNQDWNWFFSSFCQSAAALIGIIAAFVISRLLGLDEKISLLTSDFLDLISRFNVLKDQLTMQNFAWLNSMMFKYEVENLSRAIKDGNFKGLNDEDALGLLYKLEANIYKDDAENLISLRQLENSLYERQKLEALGYKNLQGAMPHETSSTMSTEFDKINLLKIEVKSTVYKFEQNQRAFKSYLSSLKSIRKIIVVLCIAFLLTVIYPLHFMPVDASKGVNITYNVGVIFGMIFTLRAVLLFIFFAIIEGVFLYFFWLVYKIINDVNTAVKEHLPEYHKISGYCGYFREE
jgi:hypothetical protein